MLKLQHLPSRRRFLIGMAGAAFVFGFERNDAWASGAAPPVPSAFEPTIWYSIDRDGIVTVNIIRAEMGQHIGTALARILADELEADWRQVRIVQVDSDPRWGYMVTGGSWSVWMTFPVFSRAGAAGRIALIGSRRQTPGRSRRSMHGARRRSPSRRPLRVLWRDRRARRPAAQFQRR